MEPRPVRRPLPAPVFIILFVILPYSCIAFNIQVKPKLVHRSQEHAQWFGYSVDFYNSGRGDRNEWYLIVGAPKGQSNLAIPKTGAVYRCMLDDKRCQEINLETNEIEEGLNGSYPLPLEVKKNELLGATVVSSKKGKKLVACAPHYTYWYKRFEDLNPVGKCFHISNGFDTIKQFKPCVKELPKGANQEFYYGFHRLGFGLCGYSAAVPDDLDRFYVSAPGAYYLQGAVLSQNVSNEKDAPATGPHGLDESMNPPLEIWDTTFMGFATATGDFNGDGNPDVVAGAPRFNGSGDVRIFDHKFNSIRNLTDHGHVGQNLGAALAVTDLNGDGYDDIIAGAPHYVDFGASINAKTHKKEAKYEVGKVVIFFQTAGRNFEMETIVGDTEWSQFGFSVAAAGDLNMDKYNDFVVGAPYGGRNRGGAVYIFHGSKDGVNKKPVQIIDAEDVQRGMRTFGFSVAAGKDFDGNGYPDIAVGAMDTRHVVVFKTKPVIAVKGALGLTPSSVNLDNKKCRTNVGDMACVEAHFRLSFEGKEGSDVNGAEVTFKLRLDSQAPSKSRAFFNKAELDKMYRVPKDETHPSVVEATVPVYKNKDFNGKLRIFVPDTIRDKLTPIMINLNYSLFESAADRRREPSAQEEMAAFRRPPASALDTTIPISHTAELKIDKNCGPDEKCIPDLNLEVKPSRDKVTIGGMDQMLVLNVSVENNGEDAYESQIYVTAPKDFEYSGIINYDNKSKIPCEQLGKAKDSQDYVFRCDIGNPIPAGKKSDFGVRLSASNVTYRKEPLEIKILTNSTNKEAEGREVNNEYTVKIGVETTAQFDLRSVSKPPQIDYSIRERMKLLDSSASPDQKAYWDHEIGPLVTHIYEVLNNGLIEISKARVDIIWPSYSAHQKHLLYLHTMPKVLNGKCTVVEMQNFNPGSVQDSGEYNLIPPTEEVKEQYSDYAVKRMKRDTENGKADSQARQKKAYDGDLKQKIQRFQAERSKAVAKAKEKPNVGVPYTGSLNRNEITCENQDCTHIACDIYNLPPKSVAVVEVYSRLVLNTLLDHFSDDSYDVSSLAVVEVTKLPVPYTLEKQIIVVETNTNPYDPETSKKGIEWWMILLAILIGLLILFLLILCLWRCGFFKRKRPPAEHATYNTGAKNQDVFADSQMRYAQPYMYSEEKHGSRI